MPIDPERLLNWPFETVVQRYNKRDTMLYALATGYGFDPTDERQIAFVFEDDLVAVPTMALTLCRPAMWFKDPKVGFDWRQLVAGGQHLTMHAPLPSHGTVLATERIVAVYDKGEGRGAVIHLERTLVDEATGQSLATIKGICFCRGAGGFGGTSEPVQPTVTLPDRPADLVEQLPIIPQAALLYRLTGDMNPLHVIPEVARAAGFERPILHGLCTFAVAGHALIRAVGGYRAHSFAEMSARFVAPIFPGEALEVRIWVEPQEIFFAAFAMERGVQVLSNGRAMMNQGHGRKVT